MDIVNLSACLCNYGFIKFDSARFKSLNNYILVNHIRKSSIIPGFPFAPMPHVKVEEVLQMEARVPGIACREGFIAMNDEVTQ